MKRHLLTLAAGLAICHLFAQAPQLKSGPMVGYSDMREVALWVQTQESANVQIAYWDLANPRDTFLTNRVRTQTVNAHTAHLTAEQVTPGKKYGYRLYIDNQPIALNYPAEFQTQVLWQWRTDPPPFKMALGSCAYINEDPYDRPGTPYGGEYHIFQSIHNLKPDMMLWLGDNTYLREVDWNSRSGILRRNTHTRSLPELQPLLASTHHYAIWDDHDFGPDNSDRSFVHKKWTLEAFKLFWANPSYGIDGKPGTATQFQWADVDFFLLDNRYYRSPDNRETTEATMLGEDQLEWLIDALTSSRAAFKVIAIGGQVLNPAAVFENYASHHAAEREYLLKRIEEEDIKNVIFVTGDRHHSELCQYTNTKGNTLYDLTVSPLTSGSARQVNDENPLRVEGTLLTQRNFGTMEFSGPRKAREVTIRLYDSNGKELWNRTIKAQ
ncbi:MAG: alkaline phosphatase family protein [Saprospiraceae bacterium]|nr:alkaline phosphatase family protein [Saprospiraceae bacterium]